MARRYLELAVTPAVRRAQEHYYGRSPYPPAEPDAEKSAERTPLGPEEAEFIAVRDSFYLATVSETGWPYLQHRGGPAGFLRVLDPHTLAFADYRGNRQLLSVGNLGAGNDRVALFLMDYPQRTRLKILGHARVQDARGEHPAPAADAGGKPGQAERQFVIAVVSFDWNCPQFITPRYTLAEVQAALTPLQTRIAELEAQLAATETKIADVPPASPSALPTN